MAKHDLVDIGCGDASVGQGFIRDLDDEAFHGLGVELAEWRMRPPDDAGCHDASPKRQTEFKSGDEVTTQFVLDVNTDDVIEAMLFRGESKLAGALGLEVPRPAGNDADDKGIGLALD